MRGNGNQIDAGSQRDGGQVLIAGDLAKSDKTARIAASHSGRTATKPRRRALSGLRSGRAKASASISKTSPGRVYAIGERERRCPEEMDMHIARPAKQAVLEMVMLEIGDRVRHVRFARKKRFLPEHLVSPTDAAGAPNVGGKIAQQESGPSDAGRSLEWASQR